MKAEITLEKEAYRPGEEVRGVLRCRGRARSAALRARGVEMAWTTVTRGSGKNSITYVYGGWSPLWEKEEALSPEEVSRGLERSFRFPLPPEAPASSGSLGGAYLERRAFVAPAVGTRPRTLLQAPEELLRLNLSDSAVAGGAGELFPRGGVKVRERGGSGADRVAVAYGVELEAEVGGWRDVVEVERKEFRVLRGPPGAGEARPVAWMAHRRSPLSRDTATQRIEGTSIPSPGEGAEEPTLALALDTQAVAPGRPLRGTATLEPGERRARAIEVTLLSQVWGLCPTDWREPAVERRVESALTVAIPEPRRGVAQPFSIDVPPDAPPTWRGRLCGRRWLLLAKADIALGLDVWLEGGVTVL